MKNGFDPSQITMDFEGLSAAEMLEHLQAGRVGDIQRVSKIFAARIKRCPKEWGKPDAPETYVQLPFYGEFRKLSALFGERGSAQAPDFDPATLVFNLDSVTAKEVYDFIRATRTEDLKAMAVFFTKVVVTCPESWGDPKLPETYMKLDYFKAFRKIGEAFEQRSQEEAKN